MEEKVLENKMQNQSAATSGLFTDFYELTMAQGYWKLGRNPQVVFDVFFRRHPFNGGFSVSAGLGTLLDALSSSAFSKSDIGFLRSTGIFCGGFLEYLETFRFTGDIWAFPEGSVVFPQEPVLRIHADLIQAQIIESLVLNTINFQSLVATKTARVWLASQKGSVMEFGLRRAQGADGAMSASRASFIGGACGTSNTLAGKRFGIPVMGTMAHSWVMSFESEQEAFDSYAELYPENSVFLIDTYDTLRSGVRNAVRTGAKLAAKGYGFGVRLDSGDIAYLSAKVRAELDAAGFDKATITVSNELTEEIIQALVQQNVPVDMWGVGSNMVTGGSESSFSGVYKLCARKDKETGLMVPVMKFSDNPAKTTNPGVKNVWRLFDANGMAQADILALEDEVIQGGVEYRYSHPMVDYRQFSFTAAKAVPMLEKVFSDGQRVNPPSDPHQELVQSRSRMMSQIQTLDPSFLRILNPHVYKVSVTQNLRDLKLKFIRSNLD